MIVPIIKYVHISVSLWNNLITAGKVGFAFYNRCLQYPHISLLHNL